VCTWPATQQLGRSTIGAMVASWSDRVRGTMLNLTQEFGSRCCVNGRRDAGSRSLQAAGLYYRAANRDPDRKGLEHGVQLLSASIRQFDRLMASASIIEFQPTNGSASAQCSRPNGAPRWDGSRRSEKIATERAKSAPRQVLADVAQLLGCRCSAALAAENGAERTEAGRIRWERRLDHRAALRRVARTVTTLEIIANPAGGGSRSVVMQKYDQKSRVR